MHNILNESVLASEIIHRSVKCSDNHEIWNENLCEMFVDIVAAVISIEGLRRKVGGHSELGNFQLKSAPLSPNSVKRLRLLEHRKIRKGVPGNYAAHVQ